ncbi:MAG TPA: relaxase/mobilization nuclease domain-containing protein [Steroidobacteraceae bacterium]
MSYGRRGVGHPIQFSQEQIAQIARTVRRTPEVMVKVSGGAKTIRGVLAHFQYIDRHGELEIELDYGERARGADAAAKIVQDWDLDLDAMLDSLARRERGGRAQTKLVHDLILSMPTGTPPTKLLAASRDFVREEFAVKHRYAMVLHTDQAHPHVHLVISAHDIDGGRLNIRKADLRRWRGQFARHLREHGVEANATPAQMRGRLSDYQRDAVYRTARRGESRVELVREMCALEAAKSATSRPLSGPGRIEQTAEAVQKDWLTTALTLEGQGFDDLAAEVDRFLQTLKIPESRKDEVMRVATRERTDRRPKPPEITR